MSTESTIKSTISNTYSVAVLGCKVNQYDAQQIEQLLECYGLKRAAQTADADLMVIHTCGVTAAAAQKSRQTIRKMQRSNPAARIIVTGCAAIEELTSVTEKPIARIPAGADWLQRLSATLDTLPMPDIFSSDGIETDTFTISRFGDHTRAFLKVQDGCNIGCSYCIIPRLRKGPRDKTIEAAVHEATALTEAGYREIVVTGGKRRAVRDATADHHWPNCCINWCRFPALDASACRACIPAN